MIKIVLRSLMWLYLLLLLILWGCMHFDTGNSWWITLFLFSPRWVLGLPWLLLLPLTLLFDFRMAKWFGIHLVVLVIPLLGLCVPSLSLNGNADEGALRLRVTTCNVGEGPIRVPQLLKLLRQERSDVLLLQECNPKLVEELKQQLHWNFRYEAGLLIATSLAVGNVTTVQRPALDQHPIAVMIAADVSLPIELARSTGNQPSSETELAVQATSRPTLVRIACVHFPTFRPAFEKARHFDSSAADEFRALSHEYRQMAKDSRDALRVSETPTLIGGDFNVPSESAFYRDYWGGYQNALSLRGLGLCYTKYTRLHGVRIDHLLADPRWSVESASVGPELGGDHRPVTAVFGLVEP